MIKSKHDLANITISILIDFDKKIAIFDFDFKIVTALGDHNLITEIRDERRRVRLGCLGERRELPQRGPPSIFLHT